MARLLILGGGRRGDWLALRAIEAGHVARVVTRSEGRAAQIEGLGAERWVGDLNRLATILGALEGVTIACWLFGAAQGSRRELQALHGALLEAFLREAVDTTMRGFVYEAAGSVPRELLAAGAELAAKLAQDNAIPLRAIDAEPGEREAWREQALAAVGSILSGT